MRTTKAAIAAGAHRATIVRKGGAMVPLSSLLSLCSHDYTTPYHAQRRHKLVPTVEGPSRGQQAGTYHHTSIGSTSLLCVMTWQLIGDSKRYSRRSR